jgi:hypothetical protein
MRARRLAACLGLALAACASEVKVESPPAPGLATVRSWNWLPFDEGTTSLVADAALRERVATAIGQALAARGLALSERPDIFASCQLALAREWRLHTETPAASFLPSLHAQTPSYVITASRTRLVLYEHVVLRVALSDARTRSPLWSARLERRVRGAFLEEVDEAVAKLFRALPFVGTEVRLDASAREAPRRDAPGLRAAS